MYLNFLLSFSFAKGKSPTLFTNNGNKCLPPDVDSSAAKPNPRTEEPETESETLAPGRVRSAPEKSPMLRKPDFPLCLGLDLARMY